MKKNKNILLSLLFAFLMILVIAPGDASASTGWKQTGNDWSYYQNNKEVTGWNYINQNWYYMSNTGKMQTGSISIAGKAYYLHASGSMQIGWLKQGTNWYHYGNSGAMNTGLIEIAGQKYFLNSSGIMLENSWHELNGIRYYFTNSGSAAIGPTVVEGKTLLFDAVGRQVFGNATVLGIPYFTNEEGIIQTGWITQNGQKYYYSPQGVMQKGWFSQNGSWYLFNNTGIMQTGHQSVAGKSYYLNEAGVMQNGWQKFGAKWNYFAPAGHLLTGWINDNNTWYYSNAKGEMQTDWQAINHHWYYLSGSGSMLTGWIKDKNDWYYANSKGEMQTNWQFVNGKWYYLLGSGRLQTGWISDGNSWYHADGNGAMQTGWVTVDGKKEYFKANGVWNPNGPGNVVVLDPGHGGSDPGSSGHGIIEKVLTLDISFRAKKLLEDAGITVIMTRSTDVFVSLPNRSKIANESNADIFVSVHGNSFNGSPKGIETFWYGKYEEANSKRLATLLQKHAISKTSMTSRGVKEGNFHVIRETKLPSALLEVGFMDNAEDAAKLKQDKYKQLHAVGIRDAVLEYLK